MFVTLLVCFLLTCVRLNNLLNATSLHSLASGVFNSLCSSNMPPMVGPRTALIFIMSDKKFSSGTDR